MFNDPYHVTPIDRKVNDPSGIVDHQGVIEFFLYKFKTSKNVVYHVLVNRYERDIFMVKFYPQRLENHKYKYNVLLYDFTAIRVLGTCYRIVKEYFLDKYEFASFGFIGVPTFDENGRVEPDHNTKRYRLYKYMVSAFHGLKAYEHITSEDRSSYLLVPKNNDTKKNIKFALELYGRLFPNVEE